MMIHNKAQLERTRVEIGNFRSRMARVRRKMRPGILRNLQLAGLRRMLLHLERQARVYEEAERGRVRSSILDELLSVAEDGCLPRVGDAIALLRVSRGMTQEELARQIGTRREVVARWERGTYSGYTLGSLAKIFAALGRRLSLHVGVAG